MSLYILEKGKTEMEHVLLMKSSSDDGELTARRKGGTDHSVEDNSHCTEESH